LIDRINLVRRHNPVLTSIDTSSPLTVGNGSLAYTAGITGTQSLGCLYHNNVPLLTMSQWGWHTDPVSEKYTLDDVKMTRYEYGGRVFEYASECHSGNEEIYNLLRHNPHRLNLADITFLYRDMPLPEDAITDIRQELDLYTGELKSAFRLFGKRVNVSAVCAKTADALGFRIISDVNLSVCIGFYYASHKKDATDLVSAGRHATNILDNGFIERIIDNDRYYIQINAEGGFKHPGAHCITINGSPDFSFAICFGPDKNIAPKWDFARVLSDSSKGWESFWQNGGIIDFSRCKDPRAKELERRMILSMYLTAAQCSGDIPPQETGLTCNSWYGKFHLEMHILHAGWFPLWGQAKLLEKSLGWYKKILPRARENAARNGFKGARWPKMTGPAGVDSPSWIATLLIWQQPHIIYMLELLRLSRPQNKREDFMRENFSLIYETAEFMRDFTGFDALTKSYSLNPPIIPAQEEHAPMDVINPVFELCYWRFGLETAAMWADTLGEPNTQWREVLSGLADIPVINGLYPAHQNCPDTFTRFNRDHPSMLYGYGFIPCDSVDKSVMEKTADHALSCWDKQTLWGWDFALIAMTYTRLNRPDKAIDVLLSDTPKNSYVISGNNYQKGRDDLPVYLPGNGSLLLALAMMTAGCGDAGDTPGFPKNGMWDIEYEKINPLPR